MPSTRRRTRKTKPPEYPWADYDDEALLQLRFSSLRLRLKSSPVWADVERLRDYAGWPALKKLEFVDELMDEIATEPPKHRDRSVREPLAAVDQTLGEHYLAKQMRINSSWLE